MERVGPTIALVAALMLSPADAPAQAPTAAAKAGEEYEISRRYETSSRTTDGSSGSSSGQDVIVERVIAVRGDGLELEYDLPKTATAERRAREWKFPLRIFKPWNGTTQLLNRPELEARIDRWLKAAKWDRSACGRWIFTWNAFRIECDPQAAIGTVEGFDLRIADVREGAPYKVPGARAPATLARKASGPDGTSFTVSLEVDPEAVRRARAESDVMAGEIMRTPVTLEASLRERAKESITGTITVTLDADAGGNVWRRTTVTRLTTRRPDGVVESATATETVERPPVS